MAAPRQPQSVPESDGPPGALALEPLLLGVLDAFDDPVSVTTAIRDRERRILDFRIEFVNAAACRWAGADRSDLIGRLVGDVLPNVRSSGLFDALVTVVDTGVPLDQVAMPYTDQIPGGLAFSGVYDIGTVRLGDGYVNTWRDVGDRERTAAELLRSTELLRAIIDSSPFAAAG